MAIQFPTDVFGLQNALIIDKADIYRGLPQGGQIDPAIKTSSLGTPVFSDLTLKGGTYSDNAGNTFTFEDVYFETVVMIVEQEKRIIETEIQGRDGSVAEYIGLSDYMITINAVLTFPNGTYDRELVTRMKQLLVAPVAVKCVSWYLQMWDIDEVIVQAYSVPQIQGAYSMQPVSIAAKSDRNLDITEY